MEARAFMSLEKNRTEEGRRTERGRVGVIL